MQEERNNKVKRCTKGNDISEKDLQDKSEEVYLMESLKRIKESNNITVYLKTNFDSRKSVIKEEVRAEIIKKDDSEEKLVEKSPIFPKIFVPDQLSYLRALAKEESTVGVAEECKVKSIQVFIVFLFLVILSNKLELSCAKLSTSQLLVNSCCSFLLYSV